MEPSTEQKMKSLKYKLLNAERLLKEVKRIIPIGSVEWINIQMYFEGEFDN